MEPSIKEKGWSREAEESVWKEWVSKEPYKFDRADSRPVYSIDTPPPYINSPVHIGHAATYSIMDMFARFRRMTGFNVLFPLGLDKNGLPIEMAAEKRFNVRLGDVKREQFIEMCSQVLKEAGQVSVNSFQRLGIGFNSWAVGTGLGEVYETDSSDYRALTQATFIDLWNKKLIYEDERINNYCPGCQTTLADAEVEYADLPAFFNELVFTVKETREKIVIGTTRPELLCSCAMVIFHPEDQRYIHLDGKTAVTPVYNRHVPIRPHPAASMEKGTGLVMMCSMGDTTDIRFFREMNLEPVIAIGRDGRMNDNAGFLKGMKVAEARKAIVERLRGDGLLIGQKSTVHRTPICERSKNPIEFISMRELYVRQVEFREELRKLAMKLKFYSDSSRQILLDWIDAVSIDWPISRRRYYATEVPLWHCSQCSYAMVPPKGRYYQPWRESPPESKCPKCGSSQLVGDPRVFDTWFDSSNSPLYILQYSRDDGFFRKNMPCTLRPQGKEIIRTWLYYTVLKGWLLTGRLVFADAWINYHIVDDRGLKMSKSKGNIIDPQELLNKYGAEPFRLWCAIEGNLESTDLRCSFERIDGAGKTIIKLWNVARFISMFEPPASQPKLEELDVWILDELNGIIAYSHEQYSRYNFHSPATMIKHFLWETFASHYMELVKSRAYNRDGKFSNESQQSAAYTLHKCLDALLQLLAPIIPMVTYRLYKDLRGRDVHFEPFPNHSRKTKLKFNTPDIVSLNSSIWKEHTDKGLSLKAEIREAVIPRKFSSISADLVATHNIKSLKWGSELKIVF
ncbi:valine--tRNA ligase [Candidatus Woesearchaeota archaeon]|nr:valine--tRNA ligase [Candidatus Woesearchaeota archaeon]